MQRRSLLKLGLASAALLLVAGGTAAFVQPGLAAGKLTEAGREVFHAVGRAVLDGTLPSEPARREQALQGLLQRIDALIIALPPHAQDELSQLLSLLAVAPGRKLLANLDEDWPAASIAQLQQALQSMRFSSVVLRRQAYAGLHDIAGAAYFSEPSTWTVMGYPGPVAL